MSSTEPARIVTSCLTRGFRLGTMCFKPRNSFLITLALPTFALPPSSYHPCGAVWLSFLVRGVVTGIGQARHVVFDRVAAFVASSCKATKDETAKGQNNAAHLSSPVLARRRNGSLPAIEAPVKQ